MAKKKKSNKKSPEKENIKDPNPGKFPSYNSDEPDPANGDGPSNKRRENDDAIDPYYGDPPFRENEFAI